jgi:TonB family protein
MEEIMLPLPYRSVLALAWCLLSSTSWAQNASSEERMRACITVLSGSLQGGMIADDYPKQAREDGRTGTPQVQIGVTFDGKMDSSKLAEGSGQVDLDRAALAATQRIFPPASPAPAPCKLGYGFTVTLGVVYKLIEAQ